CTLRGTVCRCWSARRSCRRTRPAPSPRPACRRPRTHRSPCDTASRVWRPRRSRPGERSRPDCGGPFGQETLHDSPRPQPISPAGAVASAIGRLAVESSERADGASEATSRPGNWLDNAVVETFFKTLKADLLPPAPRNAHRGANGGLRLHRDVLKLDPPS